MIPILGEIRSGVVVTSVTGLPASALYTVVYRPDGLLQVEEKAGGMSALKELQPLLGDSTTLSAELEIHTSRMVLGRVIDKLKLGNEVKPKYFPLIGSAVARR